MDLKSVNFVVLTEATMPHVICNATLLKSHFGMGVKSSVNLLHIFRTPFNKKTYGGLFLSLKTG